MGEIISNQKLKNIAKNKQEIEVYKFDYIGKEETSLYDLFKGFTELRCSTFSYDLSFLKRISDNFEYMEIFLGCSALTRLDAREIALASQEASMIEISRNKELELKELIMIH